VKTARSVTCVDFMPPILDANRKAREGCANVTFILMDVTELDQPEQRLYRCCVL